MELLEAKAHVRLLIIFYDATLLPRELRTWLSEGREETHCAVQLYPVYLVAGADSGLLGLQGVWTGGDLEHQEVESFQNLSAVNDPVSQSMAGLTMWQRARHDAVETLKVTLTPPHLSD